jgi:transposase-like protein
MRKKTLRRPVKSPGARRYRVAQQKKRLAELGLSEEKIRRMNTKEIRAVLRHPKKISA